MDTHSYAIERLKIKTQYLDEAGRNRFLKEVMENISKGEKYKYLTYNRGFAIFAEHVATDPTIRPSSIAAFGYILLSLIMMIIAPISAFYIFEVLVCNLSGGNDVTDEMNQASRQLLTVEEDIKTKKERLK